MCKRSWWNPAICNKTSYRVIPAVTFNCIQTIRRIVQNGFTLNCQIRQFWLIEPRVGVLCAVIILGLKWKCRSFPVQRPTISDCLCPWFSHCIVIQAIFWWDNHQGESSHIYTILSRPGKSQGLLYKHLCYSFIDSFSHGLWKYLYSATTPQQLQMVLLVIK